MPSSACTKNELVTVTAADGTEKVIHIPIHDLIDAGVLPPNGAELFFFNDTATTEIYTLSLHDALPIFNATDVDNPATFNPQTAVAKSYGTFSIDAAGT